MLPRYRRLIVSFLVITTLGATMASCSSDDGDQSASSSADTPGTSGLDESPSEDIATPPLDVDVVLATTGDVVATLDARYQSYNVEMVEVTGGRFWQPYDAGIGQVEREPLDLSDVRLRNLADALGPVYIRVSGSWANATYFDPDGKAGDQPPEGFNGLLTGDQWKGVGAFADAIDSKILMSFASSDGVRDSDGVWQPDQARSIMEFTVQNNIPVVAAEFINEPSLPINLPLDYDAAAYKRDFQAFIKVANEVMPDMMIVGPSATADMKPLVISPTISVDDLTEASTDHLDIFSYHFYPNISERCASTETAETVLTEEYLGRVGLARDFYAKVRDRFVPGAPMWITETAQSACGGDRWAAHFQDAIRYIDTLGRLAQGDGDVVFHNTLSASDYALIDEDGLVPRGSYWAAVLWARLVGPKVLSVEPTTDVSDLTVYAHCTAPSDDADGGTTYVVVNASTTEARSVATSSGTVRRYQLTGESLGAPTAMLNGTPLEAATDGTLPPMDGDDVTGAIEIPPASVTFVVDPTPNTPCST